jgi:predicted nucleotidyltransferase
LVVTRRYARQIAEHFKPEKIILFGSFAYGEPHADSDVDLLVVMPARDHHSQAVKIRMALRAPFPMDLLVRTPERLSQRLAMGDQFMQEIVSKGKVMYDQSHGRMGAKSRRRLVRRQPT